MIKAEGSIKLDKGEKELLILTPVLNDISACAENAAQGWQVQELSCKIESRLAIHQESLNFFIRNIGFILHDLLNMFYDLADSSRFRFQVSLRVTHLFELGTRDFPLFLRGINKVILNLILLHIGCSHFGIWHVLIFLQPFDDDLACLARRIMSVGRTT